MRFIKFIIFTLLGTLFGVGLFFWFLWLMAEGEEKKRKEVKDVYSRQAD